MYLKYHNLANFIIFFGFLTIPISFFFSKMVFLGTYIFCLTALFLWVLNKASYFKWILFFLSLLYLVFSAMLRPEYSEVSFRLLTVILIIFIAFFYSQKCESKDILKLAKLTSVVGVLSAIFGLKQFLFGYSALETSLAISVGSIIKEFEVLGISRSLGLSFDPLSQGILMGITFHTLIFLRKLEISIYKRNFYLLLQIIVFISLILTLNRTSILSFLLSLSIYINFTNILVFFEGFKGVFKAVILFLLLWIIFYILNLPEFEVSKRALLSLFEVFGYGDSSDEFFGRSGSLDQRISSAQSISEIIKNTPFGIQNPITNFSINDIGFLSALLKYGFLGGGIIVSILYFPLLKILNFYFFGKNLIINKDFTLFIFSSYLIIAVSNISSFSLDGTIMMLPLWTIVCLTYLKQKDVYIEDMG